MWGGSAATVAPAGTSGRVIPGYTTFQYGAIFKHLEFSFKNGNIKGLLQNLALLSAAWQFCRLHENSKNKDSSRQAKCESAQAKCERYILEARLRDACPAS